MANLGKMSKKQLETFARNELGIELDRRHSKKQLIATVENHLESSQPEGSDDLSLVRQYIKDLSGLRRDAAIIHEIIKDDKEDDYGTDDEIRELISRKEFTQLLGELP